MKYFCLLLLLAGACLATAAEPLRPGIYSGTWMGSPDGIRTSEGVSIAISTNRVNTFSFITIDPITGSQVLRCIPVRFVNARVLRERSSRTSAFRAVRQGSENSIRGWFRFSGRRILFYADYSSPLPPEEE